MTIITFKGKICLDIAYMERQFWNTRYSEHDFVYGKAPNQFFKQFIDTHKPGTILLPAEGEGRNSRYAASKGWRVDAFDFSEVATAKALKLTESLRPSINYWTQDIATFKATKRYDAVALIYVHLPQALRQVFHEEVFNALQSGGFLVFEAFAKEQVNMKSGGPKDLSLLYDAPSICSDFPFLHLLSCGQKEIELNEGEFHKGKATVLQLIGQRL
ncbi:class I SAM-dependent methyltransferase [Hydrobacter penzbergensis]|nr:class I SAM-dependent methyltransferase [Hydrobacter penzbergensis]